MLTSEGRVLPVGDGAALYVFSHVMILLTDVDNILRPQPGGHQP